MTPDRMDLELFGEEGEGGRPRKIGVFERAHGGTLYLDEVADMPRETQGRILRVLVEQRFRRVGGDSDVQVDVRVMSSTSRDLREEIAAGPLPRGPVPPAERGAGARAAAWPSGARTSPNWSTTSSSGSPTATGLPRRRLAEDAIATLQVHDWPGNVRQLRNNVERMLILARGRSRRADHRRNAAGRGRRAPAGRLDRRPERIIALPLRDAREVFEREYLIAQIMRFGGNISRTADLHRHGALGPAPQAEVAGRGAARAWTRTRTSDGPHRLCQRPLSSPHGEAASISRIAAFSSPTASMRSGPSSTASWPTRRAIWRGWAQSRRAPDPPRR